MANIEIYTQPGCPYCVRAVQLLQSKNVPFQEINAPRGTPEREQAYERSGGRTTVPQVFVGEKALGGCDDLMALERQGKLDAALGIG
ncbi:glutaredoxin [Acetobacter indonesiensis NRIC 0313]|uniref:Glutaredoxin n=1 Tax=Acetobacter indonesiensis TaxID=104101 RepID=A0A6N3T3W7_9PROT|nr:glutaredoxin 3 [Acetobacter indonesiensis]MCG0995665.1 glutaredoxin 3 [Acetobacter indonesiensis]OUI95672.1 glutaredoxin [Acetobacter indonesiensis]GAN63814.1 glutaredoxin [Acetobacter indonesiensis]GBQ59525.1 glutaredoxin [Acetobacter indonesiensis NRIC 0313]GEN02630.1 glutaredoxin 3 [Acetobacter indonesiensis]